MNRVEVIFLKQQDSIRMPNLKTFTGKGSVKYICQCVFENEQ